MEFKQVDDGKRGFFVALEDGHEAGKLVYTWAGKDKFIIDHTEVRPDFNGKGIGKKLVMETVTFARKGKTKIMPLCTYAKSVFDKTPDIQDVLF